MVYFWSNCLIQYMGGVKNEQKSAGRVGKFLFWKAAVLGRVILLGVKDFGAATEKLHNHTIKTTSLIFFKRVQYALSGKLGALELPNDTF